MPNWPIRAARPKAEKPRIFASSDMRNVSVFANNSKHLVPLCLAIISTYYILLAAARFHLFNKNYVVLSRQ